MSYVMGNGKFADTLDVPLEGSANAEVARGASGAGSAIEIGDYGTGCFELICSAVSGTSPTLDTVIQTSKDGTGSGLGAWRTAGTFAQVTGAGSQRISATGLDRFIRASSTIGGSATPIVTYYIKGEVK